MGPVPAADSLLADRYRLLELVGVGANGQVWRAVDERLRREVAVKTVDLTVHHDDPGIVARFRREVRTSAALSSPYIAAIYDGGQDHQTAFMVMELLTGPSLAALIAEGPLDWTLGLRIAADVATGLADAHAAGIVHRDLKPANLRIDTRRRRIAVLDFGIAADLSLQTSRMPSRTGTMQDFTAKPSANTEHWAHCPLAQKIP